MAAILEAHSGAVGVDAANNDSATALDFAEARGQAGTELVAMLRAHGATPRALPVPEPAPAPVPEPAPPPPVYPSYTQQADTARSPLDQQRQQQPRGNGDFGRAMVGVVRALRLGMDVGLTIASLLGEL